MRKWARWVAVVGVVGLLAAGCGDDDDGDEESATTTAEEGSDTTAAPEEGDAGEGAVTIVGADYEYTEAPEEIPAGVVELTFENQGEVGHEVALIEIGDTPLEQFLQDFPPVLEGGPFPEYAENIAVPVEAGPGESVDVTFTVAEGNYALLCTLDGDADADAAEGGTDPEGAGGDAEGVDPEGADEAAPEGEGAEEGGGEEGGGEEEEPTGPPHYERGMAQPLTVAPGEADAQLPEADGSINAVGYDFEVDIEAGDSSINFVNEDPEQVHFASVSVFPEGTDPAAAEEAFAALLEAPEDQPPPEGVELPEDVGFSGIFSGGLGSTFELFTGPFESGRTYLLACFIQDRAGGPPHAIGNQMYEAFTVE